MLICLNVTDKTITFENGVLVRDIEESISILIGGYKGIPDFKLKVGSVSKDNIIKVNKPVNSGYNYVPKFEWLDYKGIKNIKNDDSIYTEQSFSATLKNGIYNIELI